VPWWLNSPASAGTASASSILPWVPNQ